MLIMMIPMLRRWLNRKENKKENKNELKEPLKLTSTKKIIASFFGVISGILAGIFGLSGTPPVTAALYSLGLPVLVVVGTTIFVLIFNSVAGVAGYLVLGKFDIILTLLLGSGAVLGAFLGPKLLARIDKSTIESVIPLIFMIISLIFRSITPSSNFFFENM